MRTAMIHMARIIVAVMKGLSETEHTVEILMNVALMFTTVIAMPLVPILMVLLLVHVIKAILVKDIPVLILMNVMQIIHAVNMHLVLTMLDLTVAIVR